MKLARFTELADKFDTFYLTFKREQGKGFMVATHNLNTKYIQAKLEKEKIGELMAHQVLVFNYTANRFQVVDLNSVTRLSCLSVELDIQAKRNRGQRRFNRA
ncbi:hypothetical protein VPHD239_0044 [Vibrio phage D239]